MGKNHKTINGAILFAAAAGVSLAATPSYAENSCTEQMQVVQVEIETPTPARDNMGYEMMEAKKHMAAAKVAMEGGDELTCLRELNQAAMELIREHRHRNR